MTEGCVPARERPVACGSSHTILQQKPPSQSLCSSDACGGHGGMHMGDQEAINGLVMKEHGSFYILSLFNTFNVWVLLCVHCVHVKCRNYKFPTLTYCFLSVCLHVYICLGRSVKCNVFSPHAIIYFLWCLCFFCFLEEIVLFSWILIIS